MNAYGLINLGVLPLLLQAMTPLYGQHEQREQEPRRPQQEQEARPQRQEQPQRQEEARPQRPEQPQRQEEARPQRPEQPQRQEEARPQQGKPAHHEVPRPAQDPSTGRKPAPVRPDEQPHPRVQPEQKPATPAQPRQRPVEEQRRAQRNPESAHPAQPARPAPQAQRQYADQHRGAWLDRRAHNWQAEHRSWQDRGGYSGYRIPDTRFRSFFGPSHGFRMFSFPLLVVGGFPRFQYGGFWFSVMDPWPEYWADDWYGSDDLYIEFFGGGYYLHNRRHPLDRIAVTVFVS